jgi:ribosome-binding factor A
MEQRDQRTDKLANLIKELAASFFAAESNRTSLLNVTDCRVAPNLKDATIFITVFPISKENAAIGFAKRNRSKLRDYLKANMKTRFIPYLDVEIDKGEKHRQRIDELLRE